MRLAFQATIARVDPPREAELRAEGELAGTGRWLLDQHGEITTVRYLWDVRTIKPWMNLVAPAARPLLTWNSNGVMLEAGEGLARFLKVPLVCAEFTAPAWPGARPLWWAALAVTWGGGCFEGVGRSERLVDLQPARQLDDVQPVAQTPSSRQPRSPHMAASLLLSALSRYHATRIHAGGGPMCGTQS
jgi:hypothetical protein